jgi:integrase
MGKRKSFGTVEKLNSGKYRARYQHPHTGERVSAPNTYTNKADANLWLNSQELAIQRGTWRDKRVMQDTVESYGITWITQRELKKATRDDYLAIWQLHISPHIGQVRLQDLTPDKVRTWHASRLQAGAGNHSVAYAYRILKAVCNTAIREQAISYNPCQLVGASKPKSDRREPLKGEQVLALSNAVSPRYKALVLFLALTGLRIGEATALTVADLVLDGENPSVTVRRRVKPNRSGGGFDFDTPKTKAGLRTIQIPKYLVPILQEHIAEYVAENSGALVFATTLGNPAVGAGSDEISDTLTRIGLRGNSTHDLRHTNATITIELGAPAEQLRERLGHSSSQSTAIYTHGTQRGDKAIADTLSDYFTELESNVIPINRRVS